MLRAMLPALLPLLPLPLKISTAPRLHLSNSRFCLGARCSAGAGDDGGREGPSSPASPAAAAAGDLVSDMVGERVNELLRGEENRALLQGMEKASRRVDRAREALADIERQEAELLRAREHVRQLERRESEIAESQKELLEASAMVEEAQRSLSYRMGERSLGDTLSEDINRDVERLESVKAASVSSVVGVLASLPISLYQATSFPQLFLHLTVVFISCALFGVTFRYTIRHDLDNVQLKTGTSAAFGFVGGLAALDAGKPLELDSDSIMSHAIDGAVYVSENIFIFLSAAIALDFCFKMKILSPFPIGK